MKNLPSIPKLIDEGLVNHTIGAAPASPDPVIVIWGKHPPRHDNLPLITLATIASGKRPVIYLDDVASRVFCHRTAEEQQSYNDLYRKFSARQGCVLRCSSEIYDEQFGKDIVPALFELAERTSISRFMRCLPEKKTATFDTLPASEIMNMLLELLLFERVARKHNVLVARHFTQGIILSHHKISPSPLPALVVPVFEDGEAIDAYVHKATTLYPNVMLAAQ